MARLWAQRPDATSVFGRRNYGPWGVPPAPGIAVGLFTGWSASYPADLERPLRAFFVARSQEIASIAYPLAPPDPLRAAMECQWRKT